MLNLNVKERVAIGKSLQFSVYRLVQNYTTEQEIMNALSFSFDKENLLNDEVIIGKCLMTQIVESHPDAPNDSIGTLDSDLSQATTDLKSDSDSTSL